MPAVGPSRRFVGAQRGSNPLGAGATRAAPGTNRSRTAGVARTGANRYPASPIECLDHRASIRGLSVGRPRVACCGIRSLYHSGDTSHCNSDVRTAVRIPRLLTRRMRWLQASLMLASCLLVIVATSGAFAREVSTESRVAAIREHMEAGQGLFVTGHYREAAAAFEEGFSHYPYSAFLFNAGVSHEKAGDWSLALQRFSRYLEIDPRAPDARAVEKRLERLRETIAAEEQVAPGEAPATASLGEGTSVASQSGSGSDREAMKSLVLIETEPQGAPFRIYARRRRAAEPFVLGGDNEEGWKLVQLGQAPASLALTVGRYHIVIEAFRDYNASEANMDVSPGHVHHFKANLSQGEFMAFLRVVSNVSDAQLTLEGPERDKSPWGRAPHGELVPSGKHTLWVEAPGYQHEIRHFELEDGQQMNLDVELERVRYGIVRIDANAPTVVVYMDGQRAGAWAHGESPLELQLAAGTHLVRVESDGRKVFEALTQVPAGQIQPLHVKMEHEYPRGAAWIQAIVGGAFLGGGAYFGLESNRIHDDLQRDLRAGTLDAGDPRIARGRWYAIGADAGFAIAGILGGLATYNFIRDPYPESSLQRGRALEFDAASVRSVPPPREGATGSSFAPAKPPPRGTDGGDGARAVGGGPAFGVATSLLPRGGAVLLRGEF